MSSEDRDLIKDIDCILLGGPSRTVPSQSNQVLNLSSKMIRSDVMSVPEGEKSSVVKDSGLVEMARRRDSLFKKGDSGNSNFNPHDFYIPPYDPAVWVYIPEFSSKTYKAIDILKNNIVSQGIQISPYKHRRDLTDEELKVYETEKKILEDFFNYPNNIGQSSREIFINFFLTREYCGVGALRFSEDINGQYYSMEHYPAYKLLVRKDGQGFACKDNSFFGSSTEYFKVFGDHRIMNKKTGEFGNDNENSKDFVSIEERADSIFWLPVYVPASPVTGMCRYAPSKNAIVGNLLCSKLNAEFFVRGLITRILIIVNNGRLDEESATSLEQYFDHSKGIENSNSALLLQPAKKSVVSSDLLSGEDNKVKIDVVKLFEGGKEDATFRSYRDQNDKEQQNNFAIPDLFYGVAADVTRASANVLRKLAQLQTFDPIAKEIEDPLNSKVIPEILNLKKKISLRDMKKILESESESLGIEDDFYHKMSARKQLEYLKVVMWKSGYRLSSIYSNSSMSTDIDRDDVPLRNVELVFEKRSIARFEFVKQDILDPVELSEIIRNSVSVGAWTPNSAIENVFRRLFPDIETIDEEWGNIPMNMLVMLINSKLAPFSDPDNRERLDLEWAKIGLKKKEGEELAEDTREDYEEEQPEEVKRVLEEYGVKTIPEFSNKYPEVLLDVLFSLRGKLDEFPE